MIETKLAPGLLLAMPHLLDPNFSRAVVLMVEHNDEGSFGLIVNQPRELTVSDLLQSLEIEWKGDADAVVWRGGPVRPEVAWVLHDPIAPLPERNSDADWATELGSSGTVAAGAGLAVSSGTLECLRNIAEEPPPHVRLLLGYAGWGPGQLAQEMARGSWLHADVSAQIVFDTPPDAIWEAALHSLGIDPENIVQGMGIH